MCQYSGEQLKELSNKISLVEYIEKNHDVQKKGQNYFIKCPFHKNDDTPSLCIYPNENSWYCFGCNSGGSIYNWIMKEDGISFRQSVEKVAKITGSEIEEYEESESMTFLRELKGCNDKDNCVGVNRVSLDFNKDYVEKFSDELPPEWLSEDMTEDALRHYNIRIDNNANRIVYPVFDSSNHFIGIKGRTRIATFKEFGLSKYMNYNKIGTVDYFQGWQQAMPEIKNKKSVVIFEGVKSCIKAYGWGIYNTVAAETSKLSDGQVKLLIGSGLNEVIIAFDSDQSIKSITSDNKIKTLRKFVNVSVVNGSKVLGEKMSPADMGKDVFVKLLNERIGIV